MKKTKIIGALILIVVVLGNNMLGRASSNSNEELGTTLNPTYTFGSMLDNLEITDFIAEDINNDTTIDLLGCSSGSIYMLNQTDQNDRRSK